MDCDFLTGCSSYPCLLCRFCCRGLSRDSNLPGYLVVVAEEVRNLAAGGASVEDINAYIAALPNSIPDLMTQVLDRVGFEHGTLPIGLLFSTLVRLSRTTPGGCNEDELQVRLDLMW